MPGKGVEAALKCTLCPNGLVCIDMHHSLTSRFRDRQLCQSFHWLVEALAAS